MKLLLLSLLILAGVTLTVIADIFLKKGGAHNPTIMLVGFLLYGFVAVPMAIAFRMTEFGQIFLVWEVAVVAVGIGVATAVFKEALTWERLLAFALIIFALILTKRQ